MDTKKNLLHKFKGNKSLNKSTLIHYKKNSFLTLNKNKSLNNILNTYCPYKFHNLIIKVQFLQKITIIEF